MKVNAKDFGFSVKNSGAENSKILNDMLNQYHDIEINEPGEYLLRETVFIGSNTSLTFGEGVSIKREELEDVNCYMS